MRLFVAVAIDGEAAQSVACTAAELKKQASCGQWVPRENYHITLCFLGECDRSAVKTVEASLRASLRSVRGGSAFLGGADCFERPEGKIAFLGLSSGALLGDLHTRICTELEQHGFIMPDRDKRDHFLPHITIGKKVGIDTDALKRLPVKETEIPVRRVSLMLSATIHGSVRYTELSHVDLD